MTLQIFPNHVDEDETDLALWREHARDLENDPISDMSTLAIVNQQYERNDSEEEEGAV